MNFTSFVMWKGSISSEQAEVIMYTVLLKSLFGYGNRDGSSSRCTVWLSKLLITLLSTGFKDGIIDYQMAIYTLTSAGLYCSGKIIFFILLYVTVCETVMKVEAAGLFIFISWVETAGLKMPVSWFARMWERQRHMFISITHRLSRKGTMTTAGLHHISYLHLFHIFTWFKMFHHVNSFFFCFASQMRRTTKGGNTYCSC